ncbi:MAG: hypothetical protein WBV55_11595 [Candidatus Sulfotelmatobacter sp.]
MKTLHKKMTLAVGIILIGTILTAKANAACGGVGKSNAMLHSQSWQGSGSFHPGSLRLISDSEVDPIVGMWHVTFTAEGNTGPDAPPDNTPIDNALVVWHSDKTEIMNSARPPQDGDFCMGVWEKTGKSTYKLNHFAWLANDTTNAPSGIGNPSGPTRIVEDVILGPDGNRFVGTFTLNAYDTSNKRVAHIIGVIKGTRITVNTPESSLF